MNNDSAITKGHVAQRLLDDPTINEKFAFLEKSFMEKWRLTNVADSDARERLWQAVQILGKVKQLLEIDVRNGRMAQHIIDEIAKTEEIKQKRQKLAAAQR